jgi:hypothetical protein
VLGLVLRCCRIQGLLSRGKCSVVGTLFLIVHKAVFCSGVSAASSLLDFVLIIFISIIPLTFWHPLLGAWIGLGTALMLGSSSSWCCSAR